MATITVETSFQSSNPDMGISHIQIHNKQHNYLQDFEKPVEELTDTTLYDNGIGLVKDKAIEQGVKSPEEWEKYNAKLRKSRQKDNYDDYLASLSSNWKHGKEKALKDPKTSANSRDKIRRELSYMVDNHNIPIYSSLYYVGSAKDYIGKTPEQIATIRKAKAEALREFFNSNGFQNIHRDTLSRAELHFDEKGDIHVQSQEVFFHKAKNGRVQNAQRTIYREKLDRFMGHDNVERRLNQLCEAHKQTKELNSKGEIRASYKFLNGIKPSRNYSNAEKNTRLTELVRIHDQLLLEKCAKKAYAKYGLKWTDDSKHYATDNRHLTAKQYEMQFEAENGANEATTKANDELKQTLLKQAQAEAKHETKLEQLKSDAKAVNEELKGAQSALSKTKSKNEVLNAQNGELAFDIADQKQQLEAIKKEINEEYRRNMQMRLRREREEKALQAKQQALSKREEALDEREHALDDRKDALDERENKLNEFERKLHELGSKVERQMNNLKALTDEKAQKIIKIVFDKILKVPELSKIKDDQERRSTANQYDTTQNLYGISTIAKEAEEGTLITRDGEFTKDWLDYPMTKNNVRRMIRNELKQDQNKPKPTKYKYAKDNNGPDL